MSDTLYERYITGDDASGSAYGASWTGQTFTIGNTGTDEDHNITSVKLLLYRVGSPGTVTVGIREVDEDDKPTGNDLTSGTLDGDDFTDDTDGLWYEFVLTPYELSAGTQYAIVIRAAGLDSSNSVRIRDDGSSPSYTGGAWQDSGDSGETWDSYTSDEVMFEEYGLVPSAAFMTPKKYW